MVTETKYLTVAETAKLVRLELAKHFPSQKFSVRSSSYSGGASINISWTDGVRTAEVEPIVKGFEGASFDGMNDLKSYTDCWLLPDGSAQLAKRPESYGGSIPGYESSSPHPDAELVQFGANFVFCNRHVSDFDIKEAEALTLIRQRCHCEGEQPNDRFGGDWVTNLSRRVVQDKGEAESMQAAFERVVLHQVDPYQEYLEAGVMPGNLEK